jgi:hypothetical protein
MNYSPNTNYPSLNAPNHQTAFYHQNYNQQQAHHQVPIQNQGDSMKRMLMLQQMNKNIRASGVCAVLLLALISIIAGFAITVYLAQEKHDNREAAANAFVLKKLLEGKIIDKLETADQMFLLVNYNKDECDRLLGGNISAPILSLIVFAGFNVIALLAACCKLTFMSYLHAILAAVWGVATLMTMNANCTGVASQIIIILQKAPPLESWPFFAVMFVLSVASVIVNWQWKSNMAKAEREKQNLSLMSMAL